MYLINKPEGNIDFKPIIWMLAKKEDFVPIIKLIVQYLIMPDYLQILPNINIPRILNSAFSLKHKIQKFQRRPSSSFKAEWQNWFESRSQNM